MTAAQKNRLAELENALSREAGFPVELTIRWDREFTVSADGDRTESLKNLVAKIGGKLQGNDHGYDEECDMTCVYFVG